MYNPRKYMLITFLSYISFYTILVPDRYVITSVDPDQYVSRTTLNPGPHKSM